MPGFQKGLFWEFDLSKMDWKKCAGLVVQRVIERGDWNDYYAAINLYGGLNNFRRILRDNVAFLQPRDIAYVSAFFNIKKEKMLCFTRKQLTQERFGF